MSVTWSDILRHCESWIHADEGKVSLQEAKEAVRFSELVLVEFGSKNMASCVWLISRAHTRLTEASSAAAKYYPPDDE